MSNGGKRLNELIKRHGFRLGFVAGAIGVQTRTMGSWDRNAPIGKLIDLAEVTNIPILEIIECFRSQPDPIDIDQAQIDRTGGENN
jgi:predicted transcriptional regulator